MNRNTLTRWLRTVFTAVALLVVAGCSGDPMGLLPEAASDEAHEIDELTYLIFWVTMFTFVAVELVLVWFLIRYRARPGVRAKYTHGNHTVEMIWTIAPALILVFLALYQAKLWGEVKSEQPEDITGAVTVQTFGKQFEWNFRYPGPDGEFGTKDDRITVGDLVVPVNRPVLSEIRSLDVLHSLWFPALRFKQDLLPGSPQRVWFRPTKLSADRSPVPDRHGEMQKLNYWDIVCAELCGHSHTAMSGRLFVVTDDQYTAWLAGEKTDIPATHYPYYADDDSNIWTRWDAQNDRNVVPGPPNWFREPFGEDWKGDVEDEDEDDV